MMRLGTAFPKWVRRLGDYGLALLFVAVAAPAALGVTGGAQPSADSGILPGLGRGGGVRRTGTGAAGDGGLVAVY